MPCRRSLFVCLLPHEPAAAAWMGGTKTVWEAEPAKSAAKKQTISLLSSLGRQRRCVGCLAAKGKKMIHSTGETRREMVESRWRRSAFRVRDGCFHLLRFTFSFFVPSHTRTHTAPVRTPPQGPVNIGGRRPAANATAVSPGQPGKLLYYSRICNQKQSWGGAVRQQQLCGWFFCGVCRVFARSVRFGFRRAQDRAPLSPPQHSPVPL